jgi:cytochrome P450
LDTFFESQQSGHSKSFEELDKLEYLDAFIKETLRMTGPAGSIAPRRIVKDHVLGGKYKLYKGDLLFLPIGLSHFR